MRSDALSKPIFIAGRDWRAMAGQLGVTQVMRIDAEGRISMTEPMAARVRLEPAPQSAPRP